MFYENPIHLNSFSRSAGLLVSYCATAINQYAAFHLEWEMLNPVESVAFYGIMLNTLHLDSHKLDDMTNMIIMPEETR